MKIITNGSWATILNRLRTTILHLALFKESEAARLETTGKDYEDYSDIAKICH